MTTTAPQVQMDGRYPIADVCRHLGIHRHTLRKYTEEGRIQHHYRKDGKHIFYLGKDIIKFWRTY